MLEPSVEHGFAYLEQVRDIFCPGAGKHEDVTPKMLGLREPVFDVKLPSSDTWRFDYDADGWVAVGLKEVRSIWGALNATSTTDDPQLSSPITYLDCADYPRLYLRMRASFEGDAKTSTGQLFWSTIEYEMGAERSISFEVPLDGKWHDYELDLASNPNWKGRLDRIRLDPVTMAGVKIEVDEVRLVGRE